MIVNKYTEKILYPMQNMSGKPNILAFFVIVFFYVLGFPGNILEGNTLFIEKKFS